MTDIGYYRFPPVDPKSGEVSAADDAILMGQMSHCDVPEPHRKDGCYFPMDAHFWQDDGTRDGLGTVICPDEILARLAVLDQAVARVRELAEVAEQHGGVLWGSRILQTLDPTETP